MSKVWHKSSTRVLVYGGSWEDAVSTIRAMTFGKMIDLARDRVRFYQSDLFHDALWLREMITGPMQFEWVARESGTFIGESALAVKDYDWENSQHYRFDIRLDEKDRWVLDTYESVEHESIPIEDCDLATSVAGCIYHPAPVKTDCTGYYTEAGSLQHDGETCPVHEDVMTMFIPSGDALSIAPWENSHVTPQDFPTLRNDLNTEPSAPTRKEMKMEDIIRDLREKFSEAESTKDQLESYQSDINDAVDELETYLSDLDDLINSLDSLPEISLYVDLDTVSFDS